jgi:hypothetical protein
MRTRSVFVIFLLASLATSARDRAPDPGDAGLTSPAQPEPGYIITPSGMVIFPDAPPPAGDTSTLSGAGPKVSAGPEVGPGPEIGIGPGVGLGPEVGAGPRVGVGP